MCVCVCVGGWGERGECFRSWIFLFNRDASPFFFYSRFTTRTIAFTLILAFFGVCVCVCVCVCACVGGGGEGGQKRVLHLLVLLFFKNHPAISQIVSS